MIAGRVYLAEDEALVAMELEDRLTTLGYTVTGVAAEGEAAARGIRETKPDIALLDINLAGPMSGIDVAAELRGAGLEVPVVFVTAYSDPELIERAQRVEPAGYLVKPFEERELHATVQMALYKHRAEQERRRRIADQNASELRLAHAQKSESLARMAGAIAHVFNNAFTGILLNLELASMRSDDPATLASCLAGAIAAAERAAEQSRALRRYVESMKSTDDVVDMVQACREALPLLPVVLPPETKLVTAIPDVTLRVLAHGGLLRQAIVQLVTNAGEALGDSTGEVSVRIELASREQVEGWATFPEEWRPRSDEYAVLTVRDTGCGIPESNFAKLFDPFFSTKQLGRGLGLAGVLAAVRAGGGAVAVASSVGVGSEVSALFPIVRAADTAPR